MCGKERLYTLKQAQAVVRALGMTLRKVDGEYQVTVAPRQVYYTDDIDDAVGTARLEYERMSDGLPPLHGL